jgi:hypothetical protein
LKNVATILSTETSELEAEGHTLAIAHVEREAELPAAYLLAIRRA